MPHLVTRGSRDHRVVVDELRGEEKEQLVFRSQRDAVAFLRRESRAPDALRGLRRVLAGTRSGVDVGRLTDEEVLLRLGWLVAQRRVRIRHVERAEYSFEQGTVEDEVSALGPIEGFGIVGDAAVQTPPLFETELASKEPPLIEVGLSLDPAPGEESDADALDAAAQAEALRSAAVTGVPFCEECEKARLAEKANAKAAEASKEPADDAVAGIDAPTQAAAMRSAAASGAPFCEECEKAKAAAAKGGP